MWDSFGLQKNPFDVKAVEKYGIIPVTTFMGRHNDRAGLKRVVESRSHSLSLIVGEKGIGKTSLGNITRADLSGSHFITLSEIDSQSNWSAADFMFHALCNTYETTELISNYENLPQKYVETCKEINGELKSLFEQESSSIGVQAAGFGFEKGAGRGLSTNAISFLKLKVRKVIGIIVHHGYLGLIMQFNNLDNIEEEKRLSKVLADLRDFLLTDKCHFMFLGNKEMEACFKSNSKVNDCISYDVHLGPLDYHEIKEILAKRYQEFKMPGRSPIEPVSDAALQAIYSLCGGNIRQIFYSLDSAIVNSERFIGKFAQLDEASIQKILFNMATERIRSELQPRALEVLLHILKKKKDVTNTEITRKLKIRAQNTSKYLSQLKNNNLIVALGREGRTIHYKAVNEARWLLLKPDKTIQSSLVTEI